jgi:hypothetical protein
MSKAPKQHKQEHYYAGFPKLQQAIIIMFHGSSTSNKF